MQTVFFLASLSFVRSRMLSSAPIADILRRPRAEGCKVGRRAGLNRTPTFPGRVSTASSTASDWMSMGRRIASNSRVPLPPVVWSWAQQVQPRCRWARAKSHHHYIRQLRYGLSLSQQIGEAKSAMISGASSVSARLNARFAAGQIAGPLSRRGRTRRLSAKSGVRP
jgi:hypothetical protein